MIFTLVISVLAGLAAKPLEPRITEFLEDRMKDLQMVSASGRSVLSFVVAMLGAAILLALATDEVSPVLLVLGGGVGYFQAELREWITTFRS